ncbi:MAG TPA: nitrile hydratase accessory protein [Nitrospiraceae bacterium]|jgi:nitrile hydratase subunit beta|nr:nitrile hydratase accessory protein [Nitrospiraceae bacterium]
MFTRFEEYAATQMLGQPDSPPRSEGKLFFNEAWQRTVFGMALALSKQGHFEWEDFRRNLISSIAAWEQDACNGQARWNYYERYTLALITILEQCGVLKPGELEQQMTPGEVNK